jgi:hypothetical protein
MFTVMLVALPGGNARAAIDVPEVGAAASPALEFETERVVVFKDGYGLFVKHATGVVGADGRLYTKEVPPAAVLGTFWATADEHNVVSMKAEWVEQKSSSEQVMDCVSKAELLRANEGKPLALEMNYGQTITGKLLDVLEIPDAPNGSGGAGGQLAVMQTPAGTRILPIGSVRTITGDDLATRMTRRREAIDRSKRLWFDLGSKAAGDQVTVRLFYFTSGIRWIPTYRLGGELKYDGQLALQGEILNEVEDIDGAVFDLVVGVPNFRFKGTISPLSLERVMVNALMQNAPGLMGQQMRNASFPSSPPSSPPRASRISSCTRSSTWTSPGAPGRRWPCGRAASRCVTSTRWKSMQCATSDRAPWSREIPPPTNGAAPRRCVLPTTRSGTSSS